MAGSSPHVSSTISSPAAKTPSKYANAANNLPHVNWWDLLPLIQDSSIPPTSHWIRDGLLTAYPTRPALVLHPKPPSTAERRILLPDTRLDVNLFGPPSVLSVSGSGQYVFAYFPAVNGVNSGACCIWENFVPKECWVVDQGEAVVNCWWLGGERQWVVDESGHAARFPPLGPTVARHAPIAIVLLQNFGLQVICGAINSGTPESRFQILRVNALKKMTSAQSVLSSSLEPYTGHICTHGALGLGYTNGSILIAMQGSLLPPPLLTPLDGQASSVSEDNEWEYTGSNPDIQLCELTLLNTVQNGWSVGTSPFTSVPLPSGEFLNMVFIPAFPSADKHVSHYLVASTLDFGTYQSPPESTLRVYSFSKTDNKSDSKQWLAKIEATRYFKDRAVVNFTPAAPIYLGQIGLLVSLPYLGISSSEERVADQIKVLQIPNLNDDERFQTAELHGIVATKLSISPYGTHFSSMSLLNPKQLGIHAYPIPKSGNSMLAMRNGLLHSILSSQESSQVLRMLTTADLPSKLDLIDQVWEILDGEPKGGNSSRYILDYLRALVTTYSSTPKTDNQERERLDKYMNAMLDLLYLTSARSALADCRGRDNNGSYDAECVWSLVGVCGWVVEYLEEVVSAAVDYNRVHIVEGQISQDLEEVDPLLYHVLHPVTMEVLIEALTRSVSFQSHLDVNLLGQDTNNLVSKAANELLDGSPLNLPALLDTLRSIKAEHVSNISNLDWRKAWTGRGTQDSLLPVLKKVVSKLSSPDIVSPLPLYIRTVGLSPFPHKNVHIERDVVTRKPLPEPEVLSLHTLGGVPPLLCRTCKGKTTINHAVGTGRWERWERSFPRCVCGGQWTGRL